MLLQVACDVMVIIYTPKISAFVYDNNRQIVTNFVIVTFNTKVKAIKQDGHICNFIIVMFVFLLQNKKSFKGISGEANMITVAFIQADFFY